jgi:MFS family permease
MLASCALTGTGLLVVAYAPGLAWLFFAAVPLGLGAGAVDAGLNGFVARHYTGRHMNWLHACWGIGATCGPLVMGAAARSGQGWRAGYVVLGSVQFALAVLFLATLRLWSAVPERAVAPSVEHGGRAAPTLSANSLAGWLSPLLFALYVAVEGSTALWTASIFTIARGFSAETAAWCTGMYFAAITMGRILVGLGVDRWGNRRVITLGVLVALLGAIAWTVARSPATAAAALVLMGLGFAPVYPGLMHEVPRRFAPAAVQIVIGRQSGAAYLGMSAAPPLAGWLAQYSLEGVAVGVALGVVLLLIGIRRLDRIT